MTLGDIRYYHLHFTDKETEAWRDQRVRSQYEGGKSKLKGLLMAAEEVRQRRASGRFQSLA